MTILSKYELITLIQYKNEKKKTENSLKRKLMVH